MRSFSFSAALYFAMSASLSACGDDGHGPGVDAALDAEAPDAGVDSAIDAAPDAGPTEACPSETQDFIVYDLTVMPPGYPTKTFHCAAAGEHGVVWAEQSIWDTHFTQTDALSVLRAFDQETPADPTRGIYEVTTSTFGPPPDVDDNGKVFLLFYDLGSYASSDFDGFIRPEDVLGSAHSNHADIVYLDGVRNDPTSEYVLGVLAHEFQHLIHLAYDPDEVNWLDETLSETSMVLCGYMGDLTAWVPSFLNNPNQTLTQDNPGFNYGAGMLFGTYLLERFGTGFFTDLEADQDNGIVSIDTALASHSTDDTFETVLADWALANFLDAPSVGDGRYGYETFDLGPISFFGAAMPTPAIPRTVEPHAAYYFRFSFSAPQNSAAEVHITSDSWQDLSFRWAAYPEGSMDQAITGAFDMSSASDTLVVSGVGGSLDRLVLVAVEIGGASQAPVEVQAQLQ